MIYGITNYTSTYGGLGYYDMPDDAYYLIFKRSSTTWYLRSFDENANKYEWTNKLDRALSFTKKSDAEKYATKMTRELEIEEHPNWYF